MHYRINSLTPTVSRVRSNIRPVSDLKTLLYFHYWLGCNTRERNNFPESDPLMGKFSLSLTTCTVLTMSPIKASPCPI